MEGPCVRRVEELLSLKMVAEPLARDSGTCSLANGASKKPLNGPEGRCFVPQQGGPSHFRRSGSVSHHAR